VFWFGWPVTRANSRAYTAPLYYESTLMGLCDVLTLSLIYGSSSRLDKTVPGHLHDLSYNQHIDPESRPSLTARAGRTMWRPTILCACASLLFLQNEKSSCKRSPRVCLHWLGLRHRFRIRFPTPNGNSQVLIMDVRHVLAETRVTTVLGP
jgi:hypothetical protein